MIAFYNGNYSPEKNIAVSCTDRGFLYGDGLFETLRCVNRSVVSYYDHFDRFRDGCQRARIPLPYSAVEIREMITELLQRNALTDATVRITITRGTTDQFGFGFSASAEPSFLIMIRPNKKLPAELYQNGVSIDFSHFPIMPESGVALKSTSAQYYALMKQAALDQQCYEMILCDHFDKILEGTSSNVFIVSAGTVATPPLSKGVLEGITRKRVMDIIQNKLQLSFAENSFSKKELLAADEIFLTNTNVEVLPVTRAGVKAISNGKIGPITQKILNTFRQTLIEILE
ncbi:aminotransferase class IV [bacterium]|nr:aminotransferase class IV [bacterium]